MVCVAVMKGRPLLLAGLLPLRSGMPALRGKQHATSQVPPQCSLFQ